MTRLLPYLILPLGVALLEFHGIQFWTVAVTGAAWPGWVSWGFVAAWHAWGWPVLLEAGALWAWMQSRAHWQWNVAGGVLTAVLCAAALWNVAGPVRQHAAVTAELESQRQRAQARLQGSAALLAENKPYSRLVDAKERAEASIDKLDGQILTALRGGQAVGGNEAALKLWLQIACVVLGQLLVVGAARALGAANSERQQLAADFTENTDERSGDAKDSRGTGHQSENGDGAGQSNLGRDRQEARKDAKGTHFVRRIIGEIRGDRERATTGTAAGRELPAEIQELRDFKARQKASVGPTSPAEEVYGIFDKAIAREEPHASDAGAAVTGGEEGVEDPVGAGAVGAAVRGEADGGGVHGHAGQLGAGTGADAAGGNGNSVPEETGEVTETPSETDEPEAETPEPALTARVRAARQRIETLWPMLSWEERADQVGVSKRDMSLLKNHERLALQKLTAKHVKIISENALRKIEGGLEGVGVPPSKADVITTVEGAIAESRKNIHAALAPVPPPPSPKPLPQWWQETQLEE